MLVTFTCNAYEDIMYFSDVAYCLLRLMGHSGTIPGALKATEINTALTSLKKAVEPGKYHAAPAVTIDEQHEVNLATRAIPLINLLTAAFNKQCDVLWHS